MATKPTLSGFVGTWHVFAQEDEDGQITISVTNEDKSKVFDCEADIGNDYDFSLRLTTEQIEADHLSQS